MKYTVIVIPINKQYEDVYDTTTYNFPSLKEALNFMKIAISSSKDAILQLRKNEGGEQYDNK